MVRYKACDGFVYRKIVNNDVLIPTGQQIFKNNGMIMLNETAALLWNKIQTEKTIEELCEALAEVYDLNDCEDVMSNVREFLDYIISLNAAEVIE